MTISNGVGTVNTLAGKPGESGSGDGSLSSARFNCPYGLLLDRNGDLYVSDSWNHKIRKIDLSKGTVHTFSGTGAEGQKDGYLMEAKFNYPTGLCADPETNSIYVADCGSCSIREVSLLLL